MVDRLLQLPKVVKATIDFSAFGSVLTAWAVAVTPLLQVSVMILAIIWSYFRIKEIRLSIRLKKLSLKEFENLG